MGELRWRVDNLLDKKHNDTIQYACQQIITIILQGPSMQEQTVPVMARLPQWMVAEVDQMAKAQNRSRSNMLETLLRERFGKKVKK